MFDEAQWIRLRRAKLEHFCERPRVNEAVPTKEVQKGVYLTNGRHFQIHSIIDIPQLVDATAA